MSFFKKLDRMRREDGENINPSSRDDQDILDEEEYDGNTFEIGYSRKDNEDGTTSSGRWKAVLHFLTGDLFPMRNFILSSRSKNKRRNKSSSSSSEPNMIGGKLMVLVICLLSLAGFTYYRWLYLKKRDERVDFVDMALRQKYKFIK